MGKGLSMFLPRELLVDVPAIDRQHDELFTRFEALKAICIEQNALPIAEAEALIDALEVHFATEEKFALDAGVDFGRHGEKHRRMLASVRKMLANVIAGELDAFSLIRYLDYWFERHIREEDKALGRSLQRMALLTLGGQPAGELGESGASERRESFVLGLRGQS